MFPNSKVIYGVAVLVVFGLMATTLIYLKSDARGRLVEEYGLSGGAVDFAFECSISGNNVFRLTDKSLLRDFCGCLATDMAGSLDDEELKSTARLFSLHGTAGVEVPTMRTAETAAETRIAEALQRGFQECRVLLAPNR